jgi:hypothetical protein
MNVCGSKNGDFEVERGRIERVQREIKKELETKDLEKRKSMSGEQTAQR